MKRPAAFVDRDGTLNVKAPEHEYITSVQAFEWLPGAVDGLARLARAGYVLAVVSNQRGVARGLVAPAVLSGIEQEIQRELHAAGCEITAFRYCIHELADDCECRKPKPGMLLDLARELDLDLARSWMIGDADSDVLAGRAAGCHTALLGLAGGAAVGADIVAPTLADAAERIVAADAQLGSAAASNAAVSS